MTTTHYLKASFPLGTDMDAKVTEIKAFLDQAAAFDDKHVLKAPEDPEVAALFPLLASYYKSLPSNWGARFGITNEEPRLTWSASGMCVYYQCESSKNWDPFCKYLISHFGALDAGWREEGDGWDDPFAPIKIKADGHTLTLTTRELAAVIGALRYFQDDIRDGHLSWDIADRIIAQHGGDPRMEDAEFEAFCKRLEPK